ncbi:MAG: anhydro-N-acetylmuramic acid kinase [Pirellulales bacterium]
MGTHVDAAIVCCDGHGLSAELRVAAHARLEVVDELGRLWRQVCSGAALPAGHLGILTAEIASCQARTLNDARQQAMLRNGDLLVVGVLDPGAWYNVVNGPPRCTPLSDAARLAEASGLNVVDAFPLRDLAVGGQGGPVNALGEASLVRSTTTPRVLVDLGRTLKLTYVPPQQHSPHDETISFDVGPGTRLLDELAREMTGGKESYDPGGRMAVQGRCIPELLNLWLSDTYYDRSVPRFCPHGVSVDRFTADARKQAVENRWTLGDMLCTATHLLAESLLVAVRKWVPHVTRGGEIVLRGGGQQNGMLLREIAGRFESAAVVRLCDLGIPDAGFEAATGAALAMLHLDQVPGNSTAITGAEVPRVLGRLTPGPPQAWYRLLSEMVQHRPARLSLRRAV